MKPLFQGEVGICQNMCIPTDNGCLAEVMKPYGYRKTDDNGKFVYEYCYAVKIYGQPPPKGFKSWSLELDQLRRLSDPDAEQEHKHSAKAKKVQ